MENMFEANGQTMANKRSDFVAALGDIVTTTQTKPDGSVVVISEETIDVDSAAISVQLMVRKL